MKRLFCALIAAAVLGATGGAVRAAAFTDDFSSGSLDLAKWSVETTSGSTVTVTGGALQAKLSTTSSSRHAYALSTAIALPAGWTGFTVSGRWRYGSGADTSESRIEVFGGSQFVHTGYAHYTPDGSKQDNFRRSDSSGWSPTLLARTIPEAWTDFELTVTPTGWSYEDGDEQLVDRATTHMAGLTEIRLKLGLWDVSGGSESTYYDDIVVDVVPEPAALSIVAFGGLAALRRRGA